MQDLGLFKNLHTRVLEFKGLNTEYENRKQELLGKISAIEKENKLLEESLALAKKCLDEALKLKDSIESLPQQGLLAVFEKDIKFKLEEVKDPSGSIKGLKPKFSTSGDNFVDPKDDFSAGICDVASIFLHIGFLLMSPTAKFILFDEPLSKLNIEYWNKLEPVFEQIIDSTGSQMVFVTHQPSPLGKVYKVSMESDISSVKVIDYDNFSD